MKILVINGSPKTESLSVTMRHVDFLRAVFKEHEFEDIPVSLKIKKIERDQAYFSEILDKASQADLILWAFPVYFYSVPGQLKRFIELIIERKQTIVFQGKYASTVSTSGGVYDYPAHEYVQAISEDFGMQYFPGCSLKTTYFKDLMDSQVRKSFLAYFSRLLMVIEEKAPLIRKYPSLEFTQKEFSPIQIKAETVHRNGKKLLVLSDHQPGTNLEKMLGFALQHSKFSVEVVNIHDLVFKSGCTGCVQCQFYGKCQIQDDVNELFADKILKADAVLFAITMRDRHISSQWKMLFDRSLFIAKKNVYKNIHSAFMVSGPVLASGFVNEFISIYSSSRCLHNAGYVSDENGETADISKNLLALMSELEHNVLEEIKRPYLFHKQAYFYAMRELMYIYGVNSDTAEFYRKNKLFDYPQRTLKYIWTRIMLNFLFTFPLTKKYFRKNMNAINSEQYRKVIAKYSANETSLTRGRPGYRPDQKQPI